MKFNTPTQLLKNIVNIFSKIVEKGIGSETDAILISVENGKVFFKSHQFDFYIKQEIESENLKDGKCYVSISVFSSIVNSLSETMVNVELKDKKLLITTSSSETEVFILEDQGMDDKVKIPDIESKIELERDILVKGLKDVQNSTSKSLFKSEISRSVFIYTKDKTIYFVASDTFRLCESRFSYKSEKGGDFEVLLPIKNIQKILRIIEESTEKTIDIKVDDNLIFFTSNSFIIRMNTSNFKFPDYKSLIPKTTDTSMTLLKSDVAIFLKRALYFSNNLNKMSLKIGDKKNVILAFDNGEVGKTNSTIPADIKGDVLELPAFNYEFIRDAINVIEDDKITFHFMSDKTKPIIIRGVSNSSITILISPLLS